MIELDCAVKHDEWGKLGSTSFVGQLLKSQQRKVNESTPYAELWMGTQQCQCLASKVCNLSPDFDTKPINSVLKAWPEFVGNLDITQKYGGNLPILVKIISVGRPFPLQATIASWSKNSGKCKILIAVTPGSLLCGFKSHKEIINNIDRFSTLRAMISISSFLKYKECVDNGYFCDRYLAQCFNEALQFCHGGQLATHIAIESVVSEDVDTTLEIFRNFLGRPVNPYELVVFSFLNFVNLAADQALVIPTDQIHTYLDGNYVEVSHPNDEVIRVDCGLEDYTQSPAFWRCVRSESPKFINPIRLDDATHLYSDELSNLTVELINTNTDDGYKLTADYKASSTPSGSFIVVLGLTTTVVNNVYRIRPGQMFFAPPGLPLKFTHMRSAFTLYRVSLKA